MKNDPDAPKKREDGKYLVSEWKKFDKGWRETRLKNAKPTIENQALRDRKIQIAIEREELKLLQERGELISIEEVAMVLGDLFSGVMQTHTKQENDISPQVAGLDTREARKLIRKSNREAWEEFSLGEWAKKKMFWSKLSAILQDHHQMNRSGLGHSDT